MDENILIFGATLFDGTGKPPVVDAAVLVSGNTIARVGKMGAFPLPPGCLEIDATNYTLLPGLIDVHTHLLLYPASPLDTLSDPFSLAYFHGARNLHETLLSGVLTVRDAGGADLGVKTAVEQGLLFGPRIALTVTPLSATGGPADGRMPSGRRFETFLPHPGRPAGRCDGPAEVRRKVREILAFGADGVKIYATDTPLPGVEDPPPRFTPEEMTAAVEEARFHGKKVTAHAFGSEAAILAAEAGVAAVEHGGKLNQVAVDALASAGTMLVPTLLDAAVALASAPEDDAQARAEAEKTLETRRASVERAKRAGVKIAMGSNGGRTPHGENLKEVALLAGAGLSAPEALQAATKNGARLLGLERFLGTVEKGKRADLVLFEGDPTADVALLVDRDRISLIVREGEIVHRTI